MKSSKPLPLTALTRLGCALALLALLIGVLPVSSALAGPAIQAPKVDIASPGSNQPIPVNWHVESRSVDTANGVNVWLLALSTLVFVCVASLWILLFHIFTAGAPPNH